MHIFFLITATTDSFFNYSILCVNNYISILQFYSTLSANPERRKNVYDLNLLLRHDYFRISCYILLYILIGIIQYTQIRFKFLYT